MVAAAAAAHKVGAGLKVAAAKEAAPAPAAAVVRAMPVAGQAPQAMFRAVAVAMHQPVEARSRVKLLLQFTTIYALYICRAVPRIMATFGRQLFSHAPLCGEIEFRRKALQGFSKIVKPL